MIVGINFTSVKAYTKDQVVPKVDVNSAPRIVDVEEFNVGDMKDIVKVKFEFVTEYKPDIGKVEIDGNVLWRDSNSKEILSSWKADKKLNVKIAAPILNGIFRRCLTKTVELADELRLPPPIHFPSVVEGKPKQEKKGVAA